MNHFDISLIKTNNGWSDVISGSVLQYNLLSKTKPLPFHLERLNWTPYLITNLVC
ncbi:hypothetical protein DDI_2631 [Dickeya dianthicola RNS04.9]|nr:hypothetical protein DDI_2631 [Dickeya dianthicola RNS04.9]